MAPVDEGQILELVKANGLDRALTLIRQIQGTLDGRKWLPFSLVFSASPSADATVPHGLPRVPAGVLLSRAVDDDNVIVSLFQYQAADATNIYVRGITTSALSFTAPCMALVEA